MTKHRTEECGTIRTGSRAVEEYVLLEGEKREEAIGVNWRNGEKI